VVASFCVPSEVAVRTGATFDDATHIQVAMLCDDVSAMIRARRPLIDTWIAAGSLPERVVSAVACQVVSRVLTTTATGGVGLRSETHPEYSYELTSSAAAGLNLTKAELALLTPLSGRERPFSIQPG
jgi:hypothetical protein